MFLELTKQTEAWRIARDVMREEEQLIRDNGGVMPRAPRDWNDRRNAVGVNPSDIGVSFL